MDDTMGRVTRILAPFLAVVIAIGLLCPACTKKDPHESDGYKGVPLIILDTDIGSSTDDLFAMEMLYHYMNEGKCKLLGVVVDRMGEDCAALADVMNVYFDYADVPIGLERSGIENPKVWIDYQSLPAYIDGDGVPLFLTSVTDYSTLPDGWRLYRSLLAAQPDGSVSICSIGFLSSLSQLLESGADRISPLSGVELVRKKVKHLYIMGGMFNTDEGPDYNFGQGPAFSSAFFRLWPADVPMTFSPGEVGDAINYAPEQLAADITWTDIHPIKQVYLTCVRDEAQRMWDPLTVINAVEGDALFTYSVWGTVSFHPDKAITSFTENPAGRHRYQLPGSAEWNADMLGKIRNAVLSCR